MSQPGETPDPKTPGPLASPDPWNLVAEGYEQVTRKFLEPFSRSGLPWRQAASPDTSLHPPLRWARVVSATPAQMTSAPIQVSAP